MPPPFVVGGLIPLVFRRHVERRAVVYRRSLAGDLAANERIRPRLGARCARRSIHQLVVDTGGDVRCVYGEELDLREIGGLQITRASHVEPDRDGFWWADMGPVDGPVLGPFRSRSEALGWLTLRHNC